MGWAWTTISTSSTRSASANSRTHEAQALTHQLPIGKTDLPLRYPGHRSALVAWQQLKPISVGLVGNGRMLFRSHLGVLNSSRTKTFRSIETSK
jgi:hypothetical protein